MIGVIVALAVKYADLNPRLVLFLKVGVCGGFTTFSSYALETGDLMKSGHTGIAFAYVVLSVLCGVAAVFTGQRIVAIKGNISTVHSTCDILIALYRKEMEPWVDRKRKRG